MKKIKLEFVDRKFDELKVISFFKRMIFYVKLLFLHKIHNIKYSLSHRKHERYIKIRPAGSMMTIDEAMKRSAKLKTLKDFGDWIYDKWAKWDRGFNWHTIDTYVFDDTPDKRIGWKQTWIVTNPSGSGTEIHTYPIAFTDKPFYKLRIKAKDIAYITKKYPKLLECVDDLKSGVSHESEIFRRYREFAQEIDKAEPINIVAIDRNNSDSLISKVADEIADDINKKC